MPNRLMFSPNVARAGIALIALLVVAILLFVDSSTIPRGNQPLTSSSIFCTGSTEVSLCPAVIAVPKGTTTQRQVSKFLVNLWNFNASGGPPIVARYGLLRCENPGPSPYQVTCVFWSRGTSRDASSLKAVFESSRLFSTGRLMTAHLFV